MSYRVWYRTYTEEVDVIPNVKPFDTYEEAVKWASDYMTQEGTRWDQYVRAVEIQHIQCGEIVYYCECPEEAA
jgi:hypothetical protein